MKLTAEQFNAAYPVGTVLRYFPVIGRPESQLVTTRSEAWTCGSGHDVVLLEGKSGGRALFALEEP